MNEGQNARHIRAVLFAILLGCCTKSLSRLVNMAIFYLGDGCSIAVISAKTSLFRPGQEIFLQRKRPEMKK